MRKDYIKPITDIVLPRCNGDIMEGEFSVSNYATGGGRAKDFQTFEEEEKPEDEIIPKNIWEDQYSY